MRIKMSTCYSSYSFDFSNALFYTSQVRGRQHFCLSLFLHYAHHNAILYLGIIHAVAEIAGFSLGLSNQWQGIN